MNTNHYSGWDTFEDFCEWTLKRFVGGNSCLECRLADDQSELAQKIRYIQKYGYLDGDVRVFDVNEYRFHVGGAVLSPAIYRQEKLSAYDDVSTEYDAIYDTKNYLAEDVFVSQVIREFYNGDGEVLEIGCATGRFSELTGYRHYTGIDLSPGMIKTAKQKYPQHTFQAASFESFYTSKKFDFIFCDYGTASYIRSGYLETKLFDLLKTGGKYFLMYYNQNYFPLAHLGLTAPVELNRMDSYMKLGNYSVVRGQK